MQEAKRDQHFIAEDLCLEDRQEIKILRDQLKHAREQNIEARIRGNKLIINGNTYNAQQLQQMNNSRENNAELDQPILEVDCQEQSASSPTKTKISASATQISRVSEAFLGFSPSKQTKSNSNFSVNKNKDDKKRSREK